MSVTPISTEEATKELRRNAEGVRAFRANLDRLVADGRLPGEISELVAEATRRIAEAESVIATLALLTDPHATDAMRSGAAKALAA